LSVKLQFTTDEFEVFIMNKPIRFLSTAMFLTVMFLQDTKATYPMVWILPSSISSCSPTR
jgi:hypothetical protein